MQDLLLNPAVQSGVLPALAAAVALALLGRTRALAGVPLAGFAVVVWLAVGFSLEPLTGRSKVVLGVFAAGALALALDLLQRRQTVALRVALAAAGAAAALWVAVRVLQQKDGTEMWTLAMMVAGYALAAVETSHANAGDSLRTLVSNVFVGFTAGALGLLGANASTAMMGIALGASCGIAVLLQMWRGRPGVALHFLGLPLAAFAAFGGLVASLTGSLPGLALVPMLLIPLAVRWVPRRDAPAWREAVLTAAAALVPSAAAVALAVFAAGGSSPA